METAVLSKRIGLYLFNLFLYLGIGFGGSLPFLLLLHLHVVYYLLISMGITIAFSFLFDFFLICVTKGFNIGSAIFGVKYVSINNDIISAKQAFIRSSSESIPIFVIFDFLYFLRYRTERGVIDRLSGTFAIDIRR